MRKQEGTAQGLYKYAEWWRSLNIIHVLTKMQYMHIFFSGAGDLGGEP